MVKLSKTIQNGKTLIIVGYVLTKNKGKKSSIKTIYLILSKGKIVKIWTSPR